MSTLSKGRRTHSRSVVGELPAVVTAYVTEYALGTANHRADSAGADALGHQLMAASPSARTTPTASATMRRRPRRRRVAAEPPVLGRRSGALTGAPRPSVLVITSSVRRVSRQRERKPGQ